MKYFGEHRWLVLVLPGFISLFVAGFISDFPEVRDVQLPIVYIALTALSVVLPLLCVHIYGRLKNRQYELESLFRSPKVIVAVFAFSVVFGFLFGIAHTTDYISRGLRAMFGKDLVLTSSHSEPLKLLFKNSYNKKFVDGQIYVSSELKERKNRYARFSFADGQQSYEGVINLYHGGRDSPQVYLSPACRVGDAGVSLVKGPGVWLNLEKVEDISFFYAYCSECAAQIELSAGKQPSEKCPFPTDDNEANSEANGSGAKVRPPSLFDYLRFVSDRSALGAGASPH